MKLEPTSQQELRQEQPAATILVVDDEEIIRDLCRRALKDYRVLQAGNGEEALRQLDREPVDLLLVDVMMPVMNGLDLLLQVKERDPEQLVVIMTGFADKDVVLRALKAHADDFIQKPINLLQLKTSIAKVLETKALRRELLQLRELDRLKTEFLGLVSHKLRTPATAISLFIQNLADGACGPADASFSSGLQAIRDESQYLAYLIKDLLYYSDTLLNQKQLTLEQEDLREVTLAALVEMRPFAEKKGLKLSGDLRQAWPPVLLDRRAIRFVLRALIENAVKFTPPGGEIELAGTLGDEEIVLTVSDNGPGIAEEEQGKIFEKFYQVDPHHTGQVRGFGLGLFYARQFIQQHGGRLKLDSTPGRGTRVTFGLPLANAEEGF
jgi:signal transduction histidine kinase